MRPSLWTEERRAATASLVDPTDVDVAVVGAGITGLTAALELARAGCQVMVLENRRLGSGATGFTTAKISLLQGTRLSSIAEEHGPEVVRAYVEANQEGARWIADRIDGDGVTCEYEARPALTWAHDDATLPTLEAEAEAGQAVGLPIRMVTDTDLPFPVAGGIELADQAQFDPIAYLDGLARLIDAVGGLIHEHSRVRGVGGGEAGRALTVHTSVATVRADHVLVCTGIPFVDRGLFFARLEPKRSYVVPVAAGDGTPRSMSISADEPTRSLRTARDHDGREVLLVGGAGHTVGRRPDTDGAHAELASWSRSVLGRDPVAAGWSTQDYVSQDGLAYVGSTWSLPDRVQVATGFAKWGMASGTAAGRLLAANVLGRSVDWAGAFDAGRLGPARSLPRLVKINGEVAGRFARDRVRRPATDEPLADGEGRVVRRGLRLVAEARSQGALVLGQRDLSPPRWGRGLEPRRGELGLPAPRLPLRCPGVDAPGSRRGRPGSHLEGVSPRRSTRIGTRLRELGPHPHCFRRWPRSGRRFDPLGAAEGVDLVGPRSRPP